MSRFQLVVSVLLLALGLSVQAEEEYMVQHWGVENGMSQNTVLCMLQDRQGYMWFGTRDGLNQFDGYRFEVFKPTSSAVNSTVDVLYEDENEQLWWVTGDRHYFYLNRARTENTEVAESDIPARLRDKIKSLGDTLVVDPHGVVWLADCMPGIRRYRNGNWKRLTPPQDPRFKGQAGRNLIVVKDCYGRVWVNPTGGGFGYYDPEQDELVCPLRSTSTIHSAYVDRMGQFWISTYDKGVDCLDMTPKPFAVHDRSIWGKKNGEIRAMLLHSNGQVEMVEKDERLIYCIAESPWGTLYGTRGRGIVGGSRHFPIDRTEVYDLQVKGDTVFAATHGEGVHVFLSDGTHRQFGNGKMVNRLLCAHDTLWAACSDGLLIVDASGERFIPCNNAQGLYYYKHLYVGTLGSGLLRLEHDSLCSVETGQDIVLSMVGRGDKLWMASEEGITQMGLTTGEHQYFHTFEPTRKAYFSKGKGILTPEGHIRFGYSQGYVDFYPEQVVLSEQVVPMQIRRLSVMNSNWTIGADSLVVLPYHKNGFTVEYAALEYCHPNHIQYAHMLEGLEQHWTMVGNERTVSYTNLAPGEYTLRIRSTNREGVWVDNEETLKFVIEQSIWARWWMIVLYVLILVLIGMAINYFTKKYMHLEQEMHLEAEVNNIKLQFFTNISHELRTPLTLIIGPVENMLRNEKISASVRSQLEIVDKNSRRMLRMVNQILDFRKIQSKKLKLRVQQVHLYEVVSHTLANFNKEAEDRSISLQLSQQASSDLVWVDREKIDTILYNLLSNAFKFTEDGKQIQVNIAERDEYILLSVADQGCGIAKEYRHVLFEQFTNHNLTSGNKPGTGIGLRLVKDLVDLHHGLIEVESEVGVGSTFTILLHKGSEHFKDEVDLVVDDASDKKSVETSALEGIELQAEHNRNKQVLIVEDNEDMREFLTTLLSGEYDIRTAKDGIDALRLIHQEKPDLVLSDLMMPNMNGLELTRQIRLSPDTHHLPVLLLTAKSALESRVEALNDGADDYITKPFEPEYLRARVRNILSRRENLETNYRERLRNLDPQCNEEEDSQDMFLANLLAIMEKQLDNSDLTVDQLVADMGMGRTVFFNRLKQITGLSPVEFIREIRIKRAAQLLDQGNYNISEITYMIGMSDSRYFSKCFKQTYGMTPSEYKKREKDDAQG